MSHANTAQPVPFSPLTAPPGRQTAKTLAIRSLLNWLPSYRRTGGRVVYLSADLTFGRIRLKKNLWTLGKRGAIFGGSLYACVDPCYVALLQWRLGEDYAVWDKTAHVRFKKQARETLYADIACSEALLQELKAKADAHGRVEHTFHINLRNTAGEVYVEIDKLLVIRHRPGHPRA